MRKVLVMTVLVLALSSCGADKRPSGRPLFTNGFKMTGYQELEGACSKEQKKELEVFLRAFESIGTALQREEGNLRLIEPDPFSKSSGEKLAVWMNQHDDPISDVFRVIRQMTPRPEKVVLEPAGAPWNPTQEVPRFSPVEFWTLQEGQSLRNIVAVSEGNVALMSAPACLGVRAGYLVSFTLLDPESKCSNMGATKGRLTFTARSNSETTSAIIQVTWAIPSRAYNTHIEVLDYLSDCGPGYYAYDATYKETAYFRPAVEDLPLAAPVVSWH